MDQDLEFYMALPYSMLVYPEEQGGYTGMYPDLPGCMTCAETWEELKEQLEDVKREYLTVLLEEGRQIPRPRWRDMFNGVSS